jgi:hypothetical protein
MARIAEYGEHLISKQAIVAISLERQTTEKLDTIRDTRFEDIPIFKWSEGPEGHVVQQVIARAIYAPHFRAMQTPALRYMGFTGNWDNGAGFVPYYLVTCATETVYAYCDKRSARLVLMVIPNDSLSLAPDFISATGETIPFGKVCCCCGKRRKGAEPKLRKCMCRNARYCSKTCQTSHWHAHRCKCKYVGVSAAAEGLPRAEAAAEGYVFTDND